MTRRARWLVVLVLLAAVAALVLLAIWATEGGPDSEERTEPHAVEHAASPSRTPAASASAPSRRHVHVPDPEPTDAVAEPPVTPDVAAPSDRPRVRVLDEADRILPGAVVTIPATGWRAVVPESGVLDLPADAAGAELSVTSEHFAPATTLATAAGTVATLRLRGSVEIAGRVLDQRDVAVPGVRVAARIRPLAPRPPGDERWTAETGPDGRFRLTGLPVGAARITARVDATQGLPARAASVDVRLPLADPLELRLARSRTISGRITDPAGRIPTGNVTVVMRGVLPSGENGTVWSGTVANDGTFEVPNVGTGRNILWTWTDDPASPTALTIVRNIPPGTSGMELRLASGATIEGRMTDDRGEPITESGTLYAYDDERLINSVSFSNGVFKTHALPTDRVYHLTLVANSGWTGTARGVAAGTCELVVPGRRCVPLTGRVLLPDGTPAGAGFQVTAVAVGIGAPVRPGASAVLQTDAEGAFSFEGLGAFEFVVTAVGVDHGFAPTRVPGTVLPGADVLLRLALGLRLSGRLVDAAGRAVADRDVWAIPTDGAFRGWRMHTDAEGRFAMAALPPGRVRLVAVGPDGDIELGEVALPASDVQVALPQ